MATSRASSNPINKTAIPIHAVSRIAMAKTGAISCSYTFVARKR